MARFYLNVYDVRVRLVNDGTIKSQMENADTILIYKIKGKRCNSGKCIRWAKTIEKSNAIGYFTFNKSSLSKVFSFCN